MKLVRALLLGLAIAGSAAGQARLWQKPGPCDRDCLKGIVEDYVDAMVAHDPHAATLADDIEFTENTETLPIGQGLWAGMSSNGWSRFLR
jgi:hypothetical protein